MSMEANMMYVSLVYLNAHLGLTTYTVKTRLRNMIRRLCVKYKCTHLKKSKINCLAIKIKTVLNKPAVQVPTLKTANGFWQFQIMAACTHASIHSVWHHTTRCQSAHSFTVCVQALCARMHAHSAFLSSVRTQFAVPSVGTRTTLS